MSRASALAAVLVGAACGGGAPAPAVPGPTPAAAPVAVENGASTAPSAAVASASAPAASPAPAEPSDAPAGPASGSSPMTAPFILDPSNIQKLFDDTSHAPSAASKPNGAAGADPLAKGLREVATKALPGMNADGPLLTGNLKEKQNLQTDVTLQPGKCYAILGYSKKVRDLDLYLLLPPGILSAQDKVDDNTPLIGGPLEPMCPVATTPVTYKLGIVADQGAGEVVVQLYSKNN
jgi:hypothetical protein